MANLRLTHTLLAFALLAASCSQEEVGPRDAQKGRIEFSASLPEVTSRATEVTKSSLNDITVSSFIVGPSSETPYFLAKTFSRNATTGIFLSYDPQCIWPNNNDLIRFVAFAPGCDEMRHAASSSDMDFTLGISDDGDYKLSNVKINPNIANHFDFVTAIGSGKLWDNDETPVDLKFHHQFSRIQLKAWSASKSYNLEIAGVRLGGVATEAVFSFVAHPETDDASAAGVWESVSRGIVEYISRPGDRIVAINN
ncbi:MAG: fimbrillin family protein, partial [Muribaculaceae bacterium]|nr:fimbrillin family protein [Muribaculaceae bacterium]